MTNLCLSRFVSLPRSSMLHRSLGAGVAALLSIMLRQKFPKLHCYAFCPPGGLLTKRLAQDCEGYVTSFVNGSDIIPRMSYENMERLRDDALESLARIKISKRKALRILSSPCKDEDLENVNSLLLCDKDNIPRNTAFARQRHLFKLAQLDRKQASGRNTIKLVPPGRIVHFAQTTRGYMLPRWAKTTEFNEIVLNGSFLADHSVSVVQKNINDIVLAFESPSSSPRGDKSFRDSLSVTTDELAFDADILEAPSFVCCSRPHGNIPVFVPGVLSIIAISFSWAAGNHCSIFLRENEIITDPISGVQRQGLGVSTGLWWFQNKVYTGSGPRTEVSSYVNGDICVQFPGNFPVDEFMTAARSFGIRKFQLGHYYRECLHVCRFSHRAFLRSSCLLVAFTVGAAASVAIWFAACVSYPRSAWYTITASLFFVSASQGLIFLLHRSNVCNTIIFDDAYDVGTENPLMVSANCRLSWGGVLAIAATVLWVACGFCMAMLYTPPESVEDRMLLWLKRRRLTREHRWLRQAKRFNERATVFAAQAQQRD